MRGRVDQVRASVPPYRHIDRISGVCSLGLPLPDGLLMVRVTKGDRPLRVADLITARAFLDQVIADWSGDLPSEDQPA